MRQRLLFPALFTGFSLVILIALGGWQWLRMGEKRQLVETITARSSLPPTPYAEAIARSEPADLDYLPVTASGSFLPGVEAHVFFSLAKPVGGFSGPGFLILAPFRLDDGRMLLVNRGFVPQARKEPASRPESQLAGPVTITGLLRLPERRTMFSGADDPVKNVYYVRDPAALAQGLGLDKLAGTGRVERAILDLKSPTPPGGLPVPAVTQINIPNNHFQYALTWWSLAAVLAAIFMVFALREEA